MNRSAYAALKNAGFYNVIDRERLEQGKRSAVPAVRELIDYYLRNEGTPLDAAADRRWGLDASRFTDRFASSEASPRDRMDEVAVTFLLFLSNQVSQVKIARTFSQHGAWESEWSWQLMFKWVAHSLFVLLYDVRPWPEESLVRLDELAMDLAVRGDPSAIRSFAERVGVRFESSEPYPAELHFTKIDYHTTLLFGPYYWRTLHWMAEAVAATRGRPERENATLSFAKRMWRQFTTDVMYRTLRCGICMHHYRRLLDAEGWRERILGADDDDLPRLWFDLHNAVNRENGKAEYGEERWRVDREFMRAGIESAKAAGAHRK